MRMIVLFCITFLIGCAAFQPPRDDIIKGVKDGVVYKRDMRVCINGPCFEGVGVVDQSPEYKFKVESYGNLDLFTFSTCHREETTQEFATRKRWFGKKGNKKANGVYRPDALEREYCPAYINGYDKRGRHSFGFVDFKHTNYKLVAGLACNGEQRDVEGVSVCQSKAGLIQRISFNQPTKVSSKGNPANCKVISGEQNIFEFEIPNGECVFTFYSSGQLHRLTTIGYEAIIIRED